MKKRIAHAVGYEPEDGAPRIVARGTGYMADKLIQLAKSVGVPIVKDESLGELLQQIPEGALIDEMYWKAVAGILGFVLAEERRCVK